MLHAMNQVLARPLVCALAHTVQCMQVVVGTGHHKLRLYDVAAKRRPALEVAFGDARVTALAAQADGARWLAVVLSACLVIPPLSAGTLSLKAAHLDYRFVQCTAKTFTCKAQSWVELA